MGTPPHTHSLSLTHTLSHKHSSTPLFRTAPLPSSPLQVRIQAHPDVSLLKQVQVLTRDLTEARSQLEAAARRAQHQQAELSAAGLNLAAVKNSLMSAEAREKKVRCGGESGEWSEMK